ncbi:MAG: energy-coupling factor ABC transporter permease, partial [Oligoflexales bacterium]|nr:energy-coupling factor ABC transporter permease [Oligoflexales bacterium]
MHMADALVSAQVGGVMWAATIAAATLSIKKIKSGIDEKKIPLMGVMGAFVFAAQMINFSIPATGSSGHLGGGLLLAALLGPHAGFITMASILTVQALFFADGGLLALGCNIFNLGFYTCFISYPFIYKPIVKKGFNLKRLAPACLVSGVAGLQMGSFSVVLETFLSGKSELPFGTFVLLMQPIHLAIGIVEGAVTCAVLNFILSARPEILENGYDTTRQEGLNIRGVVTALGISFFLVGGVLSWF